MAHPLCSYSHQKKARRNRVARPLHGDLAIVLPVVDRKWEYVVAILSAALLTAVCITTVKSFSKTSTAKKTA